MVRPLGVPERTDAARILDERRPDRGRAERGPAMIERSEWCWFGNAGHFILGHDCRFHLTTLVGPWLVSTVGQLWHESEVREIKAQSKGIALNGKGDARRADYMKKIGYDEIGYGRTFETMVFRAGEPCAAEECNCGLPALAAAFELDMEGYNDAGAATRGHYAMCEKWAAITVEEAEAARV